MWSWFLRVNFATISESPFERSIEINVAGSHLLDSLVAYTYTFAPNGQRTSVTESQGRAKEALAKEASSAGS